MVRLELHEEVARNILDQLEHRPMPPLDERELAQNELYNALIAALNRRTNEDHD